MKEFHPY